MSRLTNTEIEQRYTSDDPVIRLCDEMVLLRNSFNQLDRLRANKQWMQLAAALSNLEWAAKNAGYCVNDLIRPKP